MSTKEIKMHGRNFVIYSDGRVYADGFIDKRGHRQSAKFLKLTNNGQGYRSITISVDRKSKTYKVHRLVAEAFLENSENRSEVDHIDGDKANNRAENLRWATHSENLKGHMRVQGNSSSKYRGVSYHKARERWTAYICVNKIQKYLGLFACEIDAANAYDTAATLNGFAPEALNFNTNNK